jgi:DNA phosphorothioation-dependent restriction protein DptG
VETELDLDDHSESIRVERDPTLCELYNRDVCILCGRPNFGKKSCIFLPLISIYFPFLFMFVLV